MLGDGGRDRLRRPAHASRHDLVVPRAGGRAARAAQPGRRRPRRGFRHPRVRATGLRTRTPASLVAAYPRAIRCCVGEMRLRYLILCVVAWALTAALPASASFPGANGKIAY